MPLKQCMDDKEEAKNIPALIEAVFEGEVMPLFPDIKIREEGIRMLPHDRENFFYDGLEYLHLAVSKAGGDETRDLDVFTVSVPVGEFYGVMEETLLEVEVIVEFVKNPFERFHHSFFPKMVFLRSPSS